MVTVFVFSLLFYLFNEENLKEGILKRPMLNPRVS